MLEIASEIIICLLLAALIGFAIGYLVAKNLTQSATSLKEVKSEINIEKESSEETESIQKKSAIEEIHYSEEIEIPSENTIETPLQFSTDINEQEIESIKDKKTFGKKAIEEESLLNDPTPAEDIEIPTEHAIEEALKALEALEGMEEQKPELLSEPRKEGKDDLTQIKGIGPKVEEKLNILGIYHFEQIANWSEANMLWLEAHTLFASRDKKELWIEESKSFL